MLSGIAITNARYLDNANDYYFKFFLKGIAKI